MKKFLALAFLPFAIFLLAGLAACGGDDDDADSGDDAEATETVVEDGEEDPTDDSGDDSGDDDNGDADPYYAAMEAIAIETDSALDEIGDTLTSASEDDPDYIEIVRDSFTEAGTILETALEDVSDLDPPSEAEDAHDTFLEDLLTQTRNFANFSADLIDVSTIPELDALFGEYDAAFTEADTNFEASCLALQDVADEAGAGVDLECDV